MKALVVSGGGSHGAYAGGVIEYLVSDLKRDYDILLGTSTGSLLTPLVAINDINTIKRAYLSVEQEDIFDNSPFKIKGNLSIGLRIIPILLNIVLGKRSFATSGALQQTIRRFVTEEKFKQIKQTSKIVGCCVSNISLKQKEYKYLSDWSWEDYTKWMHASSAVPPFMSVIEHDDYYYVDGGIAEKTPIQQAINLGATQIDAIVLDKEDPIREYSDVKHVFHVLNQIIQMMLQEIGRNDITISNFQAELENVDISLYYKPGLMGSAMVFDPETMRHNWTLGYKLAKEGKFKRVKLDATTNTTTITYNGLSNVIDT